MVLTGDSHLIVSIIESNGDEIGQETTPNELPISGTYGWHSFCLDTFQTFFNFPGTPDEDMTLQILSDNSTSHDMFRLDGKRIQLVKPLDRDEKDIASIMFQVRGTWKKLTVSNQI